MRQVNMTGDNRFRKAMRSSGLRYAVLALALFLAARPGDAAVISVTNLNDSGAGSLRQAIAGAAANDTINFGVAGTITLTSGALAISKNLVISGPGRANLAISGNNASRVFSISGGTITISGMQISGGSTTGSGGGIYNNGGSVTVSDCVISGNTASSYGGGLMSETTATVVNSTIMNNTADQGGGLFNGGSGNLSVSSSIISGNTAGSGGGGVLTYGVLAVSDSTIGSNTAVVGGGVYNSSSGNTSITGSTISGNAVENSGGGIATYGLLAVTGSTVNGNTTVIANNGAGGGIFVGSGTANITTSTISGNTSAWGGGIYTYTGTANINDATVAANAANYGSGIGNGAGGTTAIGNSILANYTSQSDCYGTITSNDYNLIQHSFYALCTIAGTTTHNILGQGAVLGPLQNNGGATYTHALLSGSPAIDHGNCSAGTDQRGMGRPAGGGCDMGAFEVNSLINLALSKAGAGSGTIASNTSGGINCGGTCSANFGEGALITLTATPDSGSAFTGWGSGSGSANGCTGTGTCAFTLAAASTVTANFKLTQTIAVTQAAPANALAGTSFTVSATSSSGLPVSITTSGSCSGSGADSALITMTGDLGACAVQYNQAGGTDYVAALEVTQQTAMGECSVSIGATSANGAWNGNTWAPSGSGSMVAASEIDARLDAGNPVTISTIVSSGGTACGTGDISVAANITSGHPTASLAFTLGGSFNLVNGARITLSGSAPSLSINGIAYTIVNDVNALQNMSNNLSGRYALGSDIDASVTRGWNSGTGFAPVGASGSAFTGVFDGLGHVVDGLFINQASGNIKGLFGYAYGATLRNAGQTNAKITGNYSVGALAGYAENSTVSNCYADAEVMCYSQCGGLVGYSSNGTIRDSHASGSVSATQDTVGGLAGYSKGTISGSSASGSVSGGNSVGGLAGYIYGTLSNSYATGGVTGTGNVGGLIGSGANSRSGPLGAAVNSYATGSVSGASSVGGLVGGSGVAVTNSYWDTQTTGQATSAGGTGLTTPEMMTQATLTGFDFANTWWMSEGDTRPFLRSEYSINITNAHQLQLMALDRTASYTLVNDIDLASALTNTSGAGGSSSALWGALGFVPVGDPAAGVFSGTFDGSGHVLTGLVINRPASDYVGLFGFLGNSSSLIRNVGLVNGSVSGRDYVGGLAGFSDDGNVSGVFSTTAVSGRNTVGGLMGFNDNDASLADSYAAGAVSGADTVGGLVGRNDTTSAISRCYATGAVAGSSNTGGLAGVNNAAVTYSYWDTEASGQSASAAGTGLTTAQMRQQSIFTGFDFSGMWRMYEGHTCPLLRSFLAPLTVTADNITSGYTGSAYAGGLVNASFSVPGADTSGRLYGLAAPYNSGIDAGSYAPDLWSDQQGYDIAYAGGMLTITPAGAASPTGDLNGDGVVDVADVLRALRIAQGIIAPTASDLQYGDVAPMVGGTPQPDGKIDIGDVVLLLRRAVGLVSW